MKTNLTSIPNRLAGLLACLWTLLLPLCAGAAETTRQELVYKQTPQAELKLFVHLPPNWQPTDKRPAIVFFFGGGWTGGNVEQFLDQAEHLAQRGMVAARADYRVKSRHNVTPDQCVADAQSAVRYLRKNASKLGIDPDRIVAAGGSAGGHLAACTGTCEPLDTGDKDLNISCRANALVLFNPVLQFQGEPKLEERLGDNQAVAKAISPTLLLTKDSPPALLFYGTADALLKQGEAFVARSKELGHQAELDTAPDVGHGYFNRAPWKERTLARADKFLTTLGYLSADATAPAVQDRN